MPTYDRVQRRLVVCCDGTWQSSVSGERNIPSNVTRLCRHLARSEVVQETTDDGKKETVFYEQVVFYDPGIGTGDLSAEDMNRQGGTGAGLALNVIEAYNWLVLNWEPGDKIYVFGFSRGAYTARSLAGFVATLGICTPYDMMYFPTIYDAYEGALYPKVAGESQEITDARASYEALATKWKNGDALDIELGDDALDQSLKFKTSKRQPIDKKSRQVEVVGVWDTVGSLGIPKIEGWFKLQLPSFLTGGDLDKPGRQFHDVTISNNVRHAFHALALDERRLPFAPTLWYVPADSPRPPELTLKQVWFPGVHINVGGGSDDVLKERKSDFEQIANVTFAWMVDQVRPYLAFDDDSIEKAMIDQQAFLKMLHSSYKIPDTQSKGWSMGAIIDSFLDASAAIRLGGSRWRKPGETIQPTNLVEHKEVSTTQLGNTFEEIHPCVYNRIQKLNKRSPALEKFRRQPKANPKEGWVWVATAEDKTPLALPEHRIGPHIPNGPKNIERMLAEINGATEWLAGLDHMYETGEDLTKPDTTKMLLSV